MTLPFTLPDPARIDEPCAAQGFSDVLTQVAAEGKTLIVRRNGADLAAVMPMAQLELVRELLAQQQAEQHAAAIKWSNADSLRPPQEWFDDTDNPFEPA